MIAHSMSLEFCDVDVSQVVSREERLTFLRHFLYERFDLIFFPREKVIVTRSDASDYE